MPRTACDTVLTASPAATVALFLSDVHLQADAPRTVRAFFDFLRQASEVAQLYILGDLFEYWAGDDDLDAPFNASVVNALRALHDTGVAIFWIAGNRDFLVGERFARAAGVTLLADPSIITVAGRRIVIAHGDMQCTDDVDYQLFRAQVRNPQWQQDFLAQPLHQRLALIGRLREGSRAAQREKTVAIMDVNLQAIEALFAQSGADLMIHGHTHRPGQHVHVIEGVRRERHVLPDWDCETSASRGGGVAIDADGILHDVPLRMSMTS
ncbi:MAG: UDP-2,3-diacylglucosamine diphosphatase [Herminiimonas sp.]|nr:UDP-2,3-diacylglucosamine diphosphatase [Herminiimonas sp.]